MSTLKYTEEHEWLRVEDDGAVTVGITEYAQQHLGDLVYVQLPDVGKQLAKGEEAAVIESVKAASGILMPASGTVLEVNTAISEEPAKVNDDPMGAGWFMKIRVNEPDELNALMDEAAYQNFVSGLR
jgi:glycine cleavage system H protein